MSVFAKAKKIEEPAKTKAKKDEKEKIGVAGLANLAMVDAVVKGFTALQKTLSGQVKEELADIFVGIGNQTKKRPENFRGVDGEQTASCELRVRSSASPLTDDEVENLTAIGVPIGEIETKQDCYIINPDYFNDAEVLEKVSKALEKIKGLPEDFILRQDRCVKKIVTAETIDAVFEKGLARSLLDMVGTLAIKPTYKGTLVEAIEGTKALAGIMDAATEDEEKPAKKAKK